MRRSRLFAVCLFAGFLCVSCAWGFDVVKDGKPVATIVTPEKPDAVTKEAARLLRQYVRECTGADLAVVEEPAAPAGPKVFVGPAKAAEAAGLKTDALIGDSYFMRVKDGALHLIGRDANVESATSFIGAKGTMRAVFDFLRDQAGVRWVLPCPKGTWTPRRKDVSVADDLKVDYVPNLLYACTRMDRFYPWSAANGARTAIRVYTAGGHTWAYAFPDLSDLRAKPNVTEQIGAAIDEFARAHPETYAFANGKRLNTPETYGRQSGYNPMLCTSHPDFVPTMAKWIQHRFDQGYEVVELGESDGLHPCECPRCNELFGVVPKGPKGDAIPKDATDAQKAELQKVIDQRTEAIGKRVLVPHKAVAEVCFKSHPTKSVMLLVYANARPYLMGEKDYGLRFPPNVVAEATNASPELLDNLKRAFPEQKAFGRWWGVTLYNYWWSPYHGGLAPKQTPETIAAQMQKVLQYKIFGLYFCGGAENFAAEGPCYYVCLRTMEQPQLKPADLVAEYCAGLYGKAAPTMVEYYNALYEKVKGNPVSGTPGIGAYGSEAATRHRMKYLTCWPADKLAKLDALLKKAEGEAAGDDRALGFIRFARVGYDQIAHTSTVFQAYDAYEKAPTPDGSKKVQAALDARAAWIKTIRELKDKDPAFVRDYFANYTVYAHGKERRDFLDHEGCQQSPLGKPFTGWRGPVAPNPD